MSLHFDVTGNNENFLRKLEETKRGVSEATKFMESQGKKMDSTLHSVSFGDTLKKQIYEGSQSVNGLTAQIIKQRAVIKDVEQDVRNLGEAYRRAGAGTPKGNALFADFKSAKRALQEEKTGLFDLQTQQSQARLSVRKLKDEYSLYQKEGQNVVDSNNNMSLSFKKTLAAIGGVAAFKQLGSAIIEARAEMQQLEKSFEVLLGSKAKSDVFVKEIKDYALISPLSTSDVSKAAQTLLGFGVASEKVIPTLKMLGDVSMGNSQRFSSLALAFAQVQAAGKLTGNDLLQLVNAGFNPLKNISEKTGKSMSDLKKEMSDGSISADMVADAFKSATEQGGQFHGMIEKNADGIRNAQNILQGAIQETLNRIGEQNEGLIKGGYEAATYLVENYREIGNCITGLVGVYGTYRTALLINSVLELGSVKAVWAKVTATKAATIAQATYNKVLAMNPYVAVGMAVISLGIAMWSLRDNTSAAERTAKSAAKAMENMADASNKLRNKTNELLATIRDETATQYDKASAYLKLQKIMPDVFKNMDIEKLKLMDELSLREKINEAANRSNIVEAKTNMVIAQRKYDTASAKYKKDTDNGLVGAGSLAEKNESFMELEAAKKVVSEIEKIQSEANKQKGKEDKKEIVKNKEHWDKQKKEAETAIDAIDSKQRKLLNAGKFDKVDSKVVANYKEQKRLIAEAEKELKAYPSASNTSKQESAAEKLRKEQEKYNLLLDKQALDQARSAEDLQTQVDQARINAMCEGSIRTLEQMKLDHSKEMQQLDRQQEDLLRKKIEDEKAKFDAKEDEKAATTKGYKKQTFNGSKVTLSQSEKDTFGNQKMYLSIQQAGETQALLDKERQSWNDYLSEYGTFQEKKEAINVQYNDKIANATTEGEKASLKKELEGKQKDLNLEELKSSINFADIFGDLDAQSTDALTVMRDKLKEVINESAQDLKPTDLKALQDAFKDIDIKVSERNPFGELKHGADDYRNATQSVIKAQEDLNTVQQGGAVIVGTYLDATGKICTKLLTQEQAEKNLSDAQRERLEAQSKLNKSVNTIGQQGQQIVKAGSDLTNMLTDLGVSIPDSVKGALDGVGQVMDSMASIDLMKPMSILTGITGMLAGIGKTIGSIFGGSSNGTKVYEDMKEQLSAINEIYEKIIANSKEEIVFGGGFSSIQAANDALDTYYKKIQNYRKIAAAGGEAGASKGSHSYAYRANKRLSGDWGSISNVIGQNISSVQEMYNLTGEQLYLIQTKFPEAWRKIPSEISDSLSAIIECKDEAGELAEALNSAMTGIDTDSFYSGFIDSLSDMDTSFEDMCDNFEGYLRKSIIAGLVASQYQGRIDSLYKKWSDAAVSDKKITEEDSNALQDEYKKIVEEMMKDREDMANSFGWTSGESTSQNSTKGGFESMSQDTGTELNGRFTALQVSNEEIKNSMLSMLSGVNLISTSTTANGITLIEIRNLAISSNSYLEDIAGFQKRIVNEFGSKLESIDKGIQKFNGK